MYSLKNKLIDPVMIAQLVDQLGLLLTPDHPLIIDSRKLTAGSIFCAYSGVANDGRNFIPVAIQQNVAAILWESGIDFNYDVKNFPVVNLMQAVGVLAAKQRDYPSQNFLSIGITGTNGKTSVSHWLNQAYTVCGMSSAIIGTTGAGIYPDVVDYASTTPDPITLQGLLADFSANNIDVLAMEVSSHALHQGRVNGINFTTAIFTNLTQDHLDYHHTMEEYYQAKSQLFYWHDLKNAVINNDDKYGERLIRELLQDKSELTILSYGIDSGDLRATNITQSLTGVSFTLCYKNQTQLIQAPIIGLFNVYNLLAVCGTLLVHGISWDLLARIMSSLKPVVGRMDAQILPNKPLVVVDFAHTPDALEKALTTLRDVRGINKLICVFGCGGNRDKTKRPIMGEIAAALADSIIITSDNPRDENPDDIIRDIVVGVMKDNYQIIADRKQAIQFAITSADSNDVILIAGKGHEDYQEIGGVKYHFSDLELVKQLLA